MGQPKVFTWSNLQGIHSLNYKPMFKVKCSNLGLFTLKFGLLQFSKWLRLDKNNRLGILVALLVLAD